MKSLTIFYYFFIIVNFSVFAEGTSKNDLTTRAQQLIKNQPVQFIENKGQMVDMNNQPVSFVLFKAQTSNLNMYITKQGITYLFIKPQEEEKENNISELIEKEKKEKRKEGPIEWNRVDMELGGASIKKENIIKETESASVENYYLGHCPDGIKDVHSYEKITIKNVYPNIDWVFYNSTEKGFKYDFIVHQGADPDQIKLIYSSLKPLKLSEQGSIEIETALGSLSEDAPFSYFLNDTLALKENTPSQFKITNQELVVSDEREPFYLTTVTFIVDITKFKQEASNLIIDPQLYWATIYEGGYAQGIVSLSTDNQNNLIIGGYNYSTSFPVQNAGTFFQGVSGGGADAFILKFTELGIRLWSTYYGGNGYDFALAITLDKNDNLYVVGTTESVNFPVQIPVQNTATFFQGAYNGQIDGFILKFDVLGNRLWATYCGGVLADYINSVRTDNNDNLFLTGRTYSANFPVLNSGSFFQGGHEGGTDAFIMKFNSSETLLWSTFYGGSGFDYGNDIATDNLGNVFVTGNTLSTNFPVLDAGTFFQSATAYSDNAFILKFDNSGTRLWATRYGGIGFNFGYSIETDNKGNLFVMGATTSKDFPLQDAGAGTYFQSVHAGGDWDMFILKFDNIGNRLWSTYYGGNNDDGGYQSTPDDLSIDECGNIYISIHTGSTDIVTKQSVDAGYYDNTYNGGEWDGFIAKLSNAGTLLWATFVGGNGTDYRFPITNDLNGNLYYGGEWVTTTKPVDIQKDETTYPLINPGQGSYYDNQFDSDESAFVMKFLNPKLQITTTVNSDCGCNNSVNVSITNGYPPYTYLWSNGQTTATATNLCVGNYTVSVSDAVSCNTATIAVNGKLGVAPTSTFTISNPVCEGINSTVKYTGNASVGGNYLWNFNSGQIISGIGQGPFVINWGTSGIENITLQVNDWGCTSSLTTNSINVNPIPALIINNPAAICNPGQVDITTAAITTGSNLGSLSYYKNLAGTLVLNNPNALSSSGTYYIKNIAASGCFDIKPVTVVIDQPPVLAITNPTPVCSPFTIDLTASSVTSGSTGNGTLSYFTDPACTIPLNSPNTVLNSGTYYIKSTSINGACFDIKPVTVTINPSPILSITNPVAVCSPSVIDLTASAITAGSIGNGIFSYFTDPICTIPLSSPNAVQNSGTYYIKSTLTTGCFDIKPVVVTINPTPSSLFTVTSPICIGDSSTIAYTGNASSVSTPTWNFDFPDFISGSGQGPYVAKWNHAGIKNVSLFVVENNCTSILSSLPIDVKPLPIADFNADYNLPGTILMNENFPVIVNFNQKSLNSTSYAWDFGDGSTSNLLMPSHNYLQTGTYNIRLIVSNQNSCYDTLLKTATIIEQIGVYPTDIFTPNGDMVNDYFEIQTSGIQNYSLIIYNRWGENVHEGDDVSNKWDGTYKNKPVLAGVYVYFIKAKGNDGVSFNKTGLVTVVR